MSKDAMSDKEMTLLAYLADVLVGNFEKYPVVFTEVRKHYFDKKRSKEFSDIIFGAEKILKKHKPKNKPALKKIVENLISLDKRTTKYKVGHVLKWGFGEDWEDAT